MKLHNINNTEQSTDDQMLAEKANVAISDDVMSEIENHLAFMGLKKGTKEYKGMLNNMVCTYQFDRALFHKMISLD